MSEPTIEVIEPHEIADWCLQFIGGAWMACHGEQGDKSRNFRAQWVGRQLLTLGRAIRALAVVAAHHPEEFRIALGKPIELELSELTRCESKTMHFGLEVRCEKRRGEHDEHSHDRARWTDAEAVKR